MRKQIKVLLLVAIVAVLFVMAMIVGSAAVEIYDGEDYVDAKDTLAEAIAAAEEGNTIKLTESVTVDATLVIDKSLNIDGGDFTITSSAADYVFTFSTDGEIYLTNVNVSSTTAGLICLTINGTYVLDDVNAEVAGLVLATNAAKANKFEGAYSFTAMNCTWTSTAASGNLLSHSKYAVYEGEVPEEGDYPVIVNLTNVTINTATTGHIVKIEGGFVTIDSCTINCSADASSSGRALYNDTLSTKWVIKAESAPYQCTFNVVNFIGVNKTNKVTIGREDEYDNIVVNASGNVVRFRSSFVAPGEFVINGGTYTCTGTGKVFESDSDVSVVVNNANFVCTNGAALIGYEKATNAKAAAFSFNYCEFEFAGTTQAFMSAEAILHTVAYDYCVFYVTAAPADVALFSANETLGTVIVLAPVGAKLTADKTLDAYVQSVSYGGTSYKLASNIEGAFANASVGASLREDLSGLMFATEISKAEIDAIVAEYAVSLADLRFYTLIAPMDYVAAANGIFDKDMLDYAPALASVATKYVAIRANYSLLGITDGNWDQDATAVSYSGVLTNVKSNTRGYAAVAMIEFEVGGDTVTLYGNFSSVDNARSVAQLTPAA